MKSGGITTVAAIFLIVVINIPPIKLLWGNDDCKYSNANGSFTFEESNSNGRDYAMADYKGEELNK